MPENTHPARRKETFVSKADTEEMRRYQNIAAQYPPLSHSKLLMHARTFQAGRNAEVLLAERELVRALIGDDFSEANLEAHKDEIVRAYNSHIAWLSGKKKPAVILSVFADNDGPAELYARRFENVLAHPAYNGDISIAEMYPKSAEMSQDDFVGEFEKIRTACLVAIEELLPSDTPKDIVDRWRERHAMLETHFVTTIKQLDMSPRQIRKCERQMEEGRDALSEIVNHNLQLAMSRIKKMLGGRQSARKLAGDVDLVGAANIGLLLGARQFNPEIGVKFSTYAVHHIDEQLRVLLRSENGTGGIQGITPHERKQANVIATMKKTFESIYGRPATICELQSLTGISRRIIEDRLSAPKLVCESYNQSIASDGDESMTLEDTFASEFTIEREMEQADMQRMFQVLREEISALPPIYRAVVEGRTGISQSGLESQETKTNKQIAQECGIAPHDVSTRYAEAIEMLKKRLVKKGYSSDIFPTMD